MKNLLLILGFPLWLPLLIAAFAIAFSLYAVLWAVTISLFAVFASLVISGVFAGIGAGIFFAATGNDVTGIALIGCGIVAIGLSIFVFYCSKVLITFAKKITIGLKKQLRRR